MNATAKGTATLQINEAYQIAAELVTKFGDKHLPVFKRLHSEIKKMEETTEIKFIAMSVANQNIHG